MFNLWTSANLPQKCHDISGGRCDENKTFQISSLPIATENQLLQDVIQISGNCSCVSQGLLNAFYWVCCQLKFTFFGMANGTAKYMVHVHI